MLADRKARGQDPVFRGGIVFFFVLSVLLMSVLLTGGNCRQSEGGKEKEMRTVLNSMPWYDGEKDDYKKYSPEEIRKMMPRVRKRNEEGDLTASFFSFLSQGFFYAFVTLVVVGLLVAIFYYLYRIFKERVSRPRLTVSESDRGAIRYGVLSSLSGISVPPDEAELKRRIERALAENDWRSAAIYLFLYALVRLEGKGFLNLRPSSTAREYARQLGEKMDNCGVAGQSVSAVTIEFFHDLVSNFERAAYGGRKPEGNQLVLWDRLKKELN